MLGGDDGPHTGLIAFRPIPHRVDGGVGNGVRRHFLGLFAGVILPDKLGTAGFVEPILNCDGYFPNFDLPVATEVRLSVHPMPSTDPSTDPLP